MEEENNKALDILEEKIEELESENKELKSKIEEFEEMDFSDLVRTAYNYNNVKKKLVALRNAINNCEESFSEEEDKTDNKDIVKIIKEIITEREEREELK